MTDPQVALERAQQRQAAMAEVLAGRVGHARRAVQIPDVLQDPDYTFWEAHRLGKYRAMLGVPLIREETVLGVIVLWRAEPEPFSDDESQLVSIFADRAVVAINQARQTREFPDPL